LERPILSYLTQSFNHPFSRISFGICGIIFTSLCALGDDTKEVVNAGALPGLCRLAHPDTYNTNYQGSEQVQYEDLLVAIAGIDPSCAAKVAKARKRYYRGFKVKACACVDSMNGVSPGRWFLRHAFLTSFILGSGRTQADDVGKDMGHDN